MKDARTIKQPAHGRASRQVPPLFLCTVLPLSPPGTGPLPCARLKSGLTVGRDPEGNNSLALDDLTVSRSHFRLSFRQKRWCIEDLQSSNGVYVNGKRTQSAYVKEQDVIRAGNSLFVLTSHPPENLHWLEEFGIVAASHAMAIVAETVKREAGNSTKILILGETGTGKDLLSSLIHRLSRRPGKFLAVNCAAIPEPLLESTLFGSVKGAYTGSVLDHEGLLAAAHNGTFLLDEIAELPPKLQAKLLRALEDGFVTPVGGTSPVPFDIKFLAATNNVEALRRGDSAFRQDLLARLEDVVLFLPPLRARKEETVSIVDWVLRSSEHSQGQTLTPKFVEAALLFSWPRNIRQLVKAVDSALRSTPAGKPLLEDALSAALSWEKSTSGFSPTAPTRPLRRADAARQPTTQADPGIAQGAQEERPGKKRRTSPPTRELLLKVLASYDGNIAAVARHFSCDRKQVYRWLEALEINRGDLSN